MNNQISLILKVFIFSTALSVLIKYGGPLLLIEPTSTNALIAVTVPPLITVLILLWRAKNNLKQEKNS